MTPVGSVVATLPDGSKKTIDQGTTLLQLAQSIGPGLAKDAVAAQVNDQMLDLNHHLDSDATVEFVTPKSADGLDVIRHSTAHVMAGAVKDLFPTVKVTIGPAVDDGVNGFYYDFDNDRGFTEDDLEKITKRMNEVIAEDIAFERKVVSRAEASKIFDDMGESYKLELLEAIPEGETVSLYQHGNFVDLCRGPHLPSTKRIKSFKLMSVAGAYWRGDSRNKMLARIYGNAFASTKELKKHLNNVAEAKKRDHRVLGKQLDLFSFSQSVGGGLVLWHPKGARIRTIIEEFWRRSHFDYGYNLIYTPHIGKAELWQTSGHLDFYQENMYAPLEIEGNPFYVKPMNCPFHIEIYRSRLKSYRDLPLRLAELGTVYRFEPSGTLHGLMRVRGFTQDDAHIFCTNDQLDSEIKRCLEHTFYLLRAFGFEQYEIFLSTRPEKFVGEIENWDKATNALKLALESLGLDYEIDQGEGVFYGPKIDIKIRDSLGRTWQCTTVQVDFNLPERFNVEYVDNDNQRVKPFMVHRALLGSLERFFGVLIEHYGGAFPVWLAPVQAIVLPVTTELNDQARDIQEQLIDSDLRVEIDDRNEKLGFKIREAQLAKIPYMLVVGKREIEQNGVAPRTRAGEDLGFHSMEKVTELLVKEAAWPKRPERKEVQHRS
jgi:threonyl-tRNA synthetase